MVNKIILLGRAGADPEVRNTQSGTKVAQLSIATTETRKGEDGRKIETTQWHKCVIWDKKADVAEQYIHKGDLVYIEGQVQYRQYEKDGVTKYVTEILVRELKLMPRARTEEPPQENREAQVFPQRHESEEMPPAQQSEDDLPF